ncbi:MAG: hypothetical protein N5P05_004287 (plasmid) [Chroococcopsis gigantea SAG 12.99]|jgi:hypothetical protein|nr:hypothetical protein [Chroococcopsis gigantea SAG 12.99]
MLAVLGDYSKSLNAEIENYEALRFFRTFGENG